MPTSHGTLIIPSEVPTYLVNPILLMISAHLITLSTHLIKILYQHTLLSHPTDTPINTPCPPTLLSTHPVNPPYQHTYQHILSTNPTDTPSTNPVNTPINTPYQGDPMRLEHVILHMLAHAANCSPANSEVLIKLSLSGELPPLLEGNNQDSSHPRGLCLIITSL